MQVRVPTRAAKYRKRNAIMRDWVAAHPGVSAYIDYEVTPDFFPSMSHASCPCTDRISHPLNCDPLGFTRHILIHAKTVIHQFA